MSMTTDFGAPTEFGMHHFMWKFLQLHGMLSLFMKILASMEMKLTVKRLNADSFWLVSFGPKFEMMSDGTLTHA